MATHFSIKVILWPKNCWSGSGRSSSDHPAIDVVERTCAEAMAGCSDEIVAFQTLNAPLTPAPQDALDRLLSPQIINLRLTWLLQ
jgi:hypothetical protein